MSTLPMLTGQVALVTGASRGIGRGIAVQLGAAGCKVYITGRQPAQSDSANNQALPTLEAAAAEVTERGGKGIAIYCDHTSADDVEALFNRIKKENDGRLDILINNAYAAVNEITKYSGKKFYEQPVSMWDTVNNVGLRNHYICSFYAARMMVESKQDSGLIVTVSSPGGLRYLFNVAYGVGKAACDRMAGDIAVELKKYNITSISLWPGAVKTELVMENQASNKMLGVEAGESEAAMRVRKMFENGESTEFSGMCLRAFAADPNRLQKTGKVLMTGDMAQDYSLVDVDGRTINSVRQLKGYLEMSGHTWASAFVPSWVRVPGFIISAGVSKL